MKNLDYYRIRQLINVRQQLDFAIDRAIEGVQDGEYCREVLAAKLTKIIYGHGFMENDDE